LPSQDVGKNRVKKRRNVLEKPSRRKEGTEEKNISPISKTQGEANQAGFGGEMHLTIGIAENRAGTHTGRKKMGRQRGAPNQRTGRGLIKNGRKQKTVVDRTKKRSEGQPKGGAGGKETLSCHL